MAKYSKQEGRNKIIKAKCIECGKLCQISNAKGEKFLLRGAKIVCDYCGSGSPWKRINRRGRPL